MSLEAEELHWRAPVVSLLLAGLLALERFAWYGSRAILVLWLLYEVGLSEEEAFDWYGSTSPWLLVGPLAAGVLALMTGPHLLYVLGALAMALAYGTLALGPVVPLWVPLLLLMVGQGLVRPTLYAIAGTQFRGRFGNLRTLSFAVLYGSLNLGAALSAMGAGYLSEMYGYTAVFMLCAVCAIVVSVGGVVVFALDWGRPPEPRFDVDTARRFAAGLLLVPLGAAFWLAASASWSLMPPDQPSWVWQLNPAAVVVGTVLVALMAALAQAARVRVPALLTIGLALLLGIPAAGVWLVPGIPPGVAVATIAIVLLAIPETALGTFAMSRLTGDLPSRLTPLLIALWLSGSWMGSTAATELGEHVSPSVLLIGSLAVLSVAAIAALALWKPLDWLAYDREDEPFEDDELALS